MKFNEALKELKRLANGRHWLLTEHKTCSSRPNEEERIHVAMCISETFYTNFCSSYEEAIQELKDFLEEGKIHYKKII